MFNRYAVMGAFLRILLIAVLATTCSFSAHADWVRLLDEDLDAEKAAIEMIDQAQHEITLSYFIFETDLIGAQRLAALRSAAKRGVEVRILLDNHYFHLQKDMVDYLRTSGIEVKVFNAFDWRRPIESLRFRMHDKMMIVDRNKLITGGRNICNDYFEPRLTQAPIYSFVDRDIYTEGDAATVAATYQDAVWNSPNCTIPHFDGQAKLSDSTPVKLLDDHETILNRTRETLAKRKYEFPLIDTPAVRFVHDDLKDKIRGPGVKAEIIRMIDQADTEIFIETPYLIPTPDLIESIKKAIHRKVKVRILTNTRSALDDESLKLVYNDEINRLLKMGVEIRLYRGMGTLHAKSVSRDPNTDHPEAYVGSWNMDPRSQNLNREVGLMVKEPVTVHAVHESGLTRTSAVLTGKSLRTSLEFALRKPVGASQHCATLLQVVKAQLIKGDL